MTPLEFFLAGTMSAATVFLLAALGELVAEKSGMLNLSIEGMMAVSAAVGFVVTYQTGSHLIGFIVAGAAGIGISMVFALVSITFLANQVATGLAVGILGLGLSALIGKKHESLTVTAPDSIHIPFLSEIPLVGPVLFQQNIVVYLTIVIAILISFCLTKTRLGLAIRACGENPKAAETAIIPSMLKFNMPDFSATNSPNAASRKTVAALIVPARKNSSGVMLNYFQFFLYELYEV